jgi:hypothetical protein
VDNTDPPVNVPGMHQLTLDGAGRMREFQSVPTADMFSSAGDSAPWTAMFEAAGFDMKDFAAVPAESLPLDFADVRAAWDGPIAGRSGERVRIEAASLRNHLVSFRIIWPWTSPARPGAPSQSGLRPLMAPLTEGLWFTLLAGGIVLARHNLRMNRADRSGAARLGIGILIASAAAHLVKATHSSEPLVEVSVMMSALADGAIQGGLLWVFYLAIEPYARRFWPDALLAWARFLAGRLHDSRVGRELLIGLAFGAASLIVLHVPAVLLVRFGLRAPIFPFGSELGVLGGAPSLFAWWVDQLIEALRNALEIALILLVPRLFIARAPLALAAGVAVLLVVMDGGSVIAGSWLDTYSGLAFATLITVVIHRFGLLAAAMTVFVDNVVTDIPLTTHLSVWWSLPTVLTIAMLTSCAAFAYVAARGGKPLLGTWV